VSNVAAVDVASGAGLRRRRSRPGPRTGPGHRPIEQLLQRGGALRRPSDPAWAIRIAPEDGPAEPADATSFYPTFLYESLWDLLLCLASLGIARRFCERLKGGDVFLLYVYLYSVGRFLVETLRIDRLSS